MSDQESLQLGSECIGISGRTFPHDEDPVAQISEFLFLSLVAFSIRLELPYPPLSVSLWDRGPLTALVAVLVAAVYEDDPTIRLVGDIRRAGQIPRTQTIVPSQIA